MLNIIKGLLGLAASAVCRCFCFFSLRFSDRRSKGVSPQKFCSPDPETFSSCDGAMGVEAFVKARQGFLFPLPAGLCFLEAVSFCPGGA